MWMGLTLAGRDMANLLDHCQEVVLLGATIGAMVERLLMRYEVKSMSDALIMDACASTAVENVCNNFESDLRAKWSSRESICLTGSARDTEIFRFLRIRISARC